jgi:hypothetical protein
MQHPSIEKKIMIAKEVLMIRPSNFGFNAETAASNSFQNEVQKSPEEIQRIALTEFDQMVEKLRAVGIAVDVINDLPNSQSPDSIFPNNWFSTFTNEIILYPMTHANRQMERRPEIIEHLEQKLQKPVRRDLLKGEAIQQYLEGTGSLVCDYENKVAYAAMSPRTDHQILDLFEKYTGYRTVRFQTQDLQGNPIYHTNVVMTMGNNFVIIGMDCIHPNNRIMVKQTLEALGKTIIDLSNDQIFNSFAGNMLLLKNHKNETYLCMSERAHHSLTAAQRFTIENCGHQVLSFPIGLIETIGGGSARCMMAELFHHKHN